MCPLVTPLPCIHLTTACSWLSLENRLLHVPPPERPHRLTPARGPWSKTARFRWCPGWRPRLRPAAARPSWLCSQWGVACAGRPRPGRAAIAAASCRRRASGCARCRRSAFCQSDIVPCRQSQEGVHVPAHESPRARRSAVRTLTAQVCEVPPLQEKPQFRGGLPGNREAASGVAVGKMSAHAAAGCPSTSQHLRVAGSATSRRLPAMLSRLRQVSPHVRARPGSPLHGVRRHPADPRRCVGDAIADSAAAVDTGLAPVERTPRRSSSWTEPRSSRGSGDATRALEEQVAQVDQSAEQIRAGARSIEEAAVAIDGGVEDVTAPPATSTSRPTGSLARWRASRAR